MVAAPAEDGLEGELAAGAAGWGGCGFRDVGELGVVLEALGTAVAGGGR